jgi:HK97 family phage prohead protease
MHSKHLPVIIEKAEKSTGYDARFVMSAATPDRVRDTIEPSAYKSAAKVDKLIALWQHDPDRPIGFWTDLKADGDRLTGYIKLAGTNLAQMVKQLIDDGVPLASSIGFRGKGEPNKEGGIHFKSLELLECSIVSVPAHPRAQQIAKSFGLSSVIDAEPDDVRLRASRAIVAAKLVVKK